MGKRKRRKKKKKGETRGEPLKIPPQTRRSFFVARFFRIWEREWGREAHWEDEPIPKKGK